MDLFKVRASLARPVRAFLCLTVGASCLTIDASCQSKDARLSDDEHIKDESPTAIDGATYLSEGTVVKILIRTLTIGTALLMVGCASSSTSWRNDYYAKQGLPSDQLAY